MCLLCLGTDSKSITKLNLADEHHHHIVKRSPEPGFLKMLWDKFMNKFKKGRGGGGGGHGGGHGGYHETHGGYHGHEDHHGYDGHDYPHDHKSHHGHHDHHENYHHHDPHYDGHKEFDFHAPEWFESDDYGNPSGEGHFNYEHFGPFEEHKEDHHHPHKEEEEHHHEDGKEDDGHYHPKPHPHKEEGHHHDDSEDDGHYYYDDEEDDKEEHPDYEEDYEDDGKVHYHESHSPVVHSVSDYHKDENLITKTIKDEKHKGGHHSEHKKHKDKTPYSYQQGGFHHTKEDYGGEKGNYNRGKKYKQFGNHIHEEGEGEKYNKDEKDKHNDHHHKHKDHQSHFGDNSKPQAQKLVHRDHNMDSDYSNYGHLPHKVMLPPAPLKNPSENDDLNNEITYDPRKIAAIANSSIYRGDVPIKDKTNPNDKVTENLRPAGVKGLDDKFVTYIRHKIGPYTQNKKTKH